MIYLDHAATSPMIDCAKKAFFEAIDFFSANPSSLHTKGNEAKNKLEQARKQIANLINADPSEIIFTSGGTESNNTIIHTFKNQNIAISSIEHQSIIEPAKKYAKNLSIIPVDKNGIIKINEIKSKPDLLSVMLVNNELGTIEPLEKIPKNSYRFFHSDLTQALGKIPIDVKQLNLDYATFSAHKIGGPTGVGAIYKKTGAPLIPLLLGGHQEENLRAGTHNIAAIISFGVAAAFAKDHNTPELYSEKILPLRDLFVQKILANIPNVIINTPLNHSAPNILNMSFPLAEGEATQLYLDLAGIEVSTGSACASGEPSYVLIATTNDEKIAHDSIRFSFDLTTTKSEINETTEKLIEIIKKIRQISFDERREQNER